LGRQLARLGETTCTPWGDEIQDNTLKKNSSSILDL
jgi:hypothetical protein